MWGEAIPKERGEGTADAAATVSNAEDAEEPSRLLLVLESWRLRLVRALGERLETLVPYEPVTCHASRARPDAEALASSVNRRLAGEREEYVKEGRLAGDSDE